MAESIKNFLAEIKEQVNDILTETGNTTQAFTRYDRKYIRRNKWFRYQFKW